MEERNKSQIVRSKTRVTTQFSRESVSGYWRINHSDEIQKGQELNAEERRYDVKIIRGNNPK